MPFPAQPRDLQGSGPSSWHKALETTGTEICLKSRIPPAFSLVKFNFGNYILQTNYFSTRLKSNILDSMKSPEVTAVILAGGKSSRFGADKTQLPWGNSLIIHHLVEECKRIAQEVLIISNHQNKFAIDGVREISDFFKEKGPLGGFHAGLQEAQYDTVFFTACDMPLFNIDLAQKLLGKIKDGVQGALPIHSGKTEPLFSVLYRPIALPAAQILLEQDKRRLMDFFKQLNTTYVECPDANFQFNLNHQEDYLSFLTSNQKQCN